MQAAQIGKAIAERRIQLGLSSEFCAARVGLSIHWYDDVETDPAEFFMNISLGTARRICGLLSLNLVDLCGGYLDPALVLNAGLLSGRSIFNGAVGDEAFHARHLLIGERRAAVGLSEKALADAIGFSVTTVAELERSADYIETLPINAIIDTALVLGLDPGRLLCHRNETAHASGEMAG